MSLQLHFLGQPNIAVDDRDITAEIGAKPLALMAYLALAPIRSENASVSGLARSPRVPRARLAVTFWSEKTDEASRYRLRHALWALRRTLGKDCVQSDDDACWLSCDGDMWIDAQEFIRGCQRLGIGGPHPNPLPVLPSLAERSREGPVLPSLAERSREGPGGEGTGRSPLTEEEATDLANTLSPLADLYLGELLDGLAVRDAPLFEEWLLAERERLDLLYQEVLWQLARAQRAAGLPSDAARTLERLLAADPLRERCYRALMGLHARQGDAAEALRVYRQCAHVLQAELGVAPSPATERLRETIAGGRRGSTQTEVERSAALLQRGQHREAWAICAAAEAMGPDPVTAGQIALLRAEIAIRQGQQGQVLALIQEARRVIGGWGLQ